LRVTDRGDAFEVVGTVGDVIRFARLAGCRSCTKTWVEGARVFKPDAAEATLCALWAFRLRFWVVSAGKMLLGCRF